MLRPRHGRMRALACSALYQESAAENVGRTRLKAGKRRGPTVGGGVSDFKVARLTGLSASQSPTPSGFIGRELLPPVIDHGRDRLVEDCVRV